MAPKEKKDVKSQAHMPRAPLVIGWRETVSMPELGLADLPAKIDTGARTSALHAERIETFERDGDCWVRFHIPHHRLVHARDCEARLVDRRLVKNTSGTALERLVIRTALVIGTRKWHIEVTLADRTLMAMPLILGRTAIRRHRVLVDSSRSFLAGKPGRKKRKKKKKTGGAEGSAAKEKTA
jgi:hypothetical protein